MLASTNPLGPNACFHHTTAKHRFRHLHRVSGAHIQRPGAWDPFWNNLLHFANWKDPLFLMGKSTINHHVLMENHYF
jgi:hypothetical protein